MAVTALSKVIVLLEGPGGVRAGDMGCEGMRPVHVTGKGH